MRQQPLPLSVNENSACHMRPAPNLLHHALAEALQRVQFWIVSLMKV